MSSIMDNPRVKRLVKIQDSLRDALPGEDIEIVDAEAVYVNFGYQTAVCVTPDDDQPDFVQVDVTEWDQSGGVDSEFLIAGHVRQEYVPVIVKTFLDEQRRREAELDKMLAEEPRELIDPDKLVIVSAQHVNTEIGTHDAGDCRPGCSFFKKEN